MGELSIVTELPSHEGHVLRVMSDHFITILTLVGTMQLEEMRLLTLSMSQAAQASGLCAHLSRLVSPPVTSFALHELLVQQLAG